MLPLSWDSSSLRDMFSLWRAAQMEDKINTHNLVKICTSYLCSSPAKALLVVLMVSPGGGQGKGSSHTQLQRWGEGM